MTIASSKYKAYGIQQRTPTKQTKKNDLYAKYTQTATPFLFFDSKSEMKSFGWTNCIWLSNFTSSKIFDFWQSKYHQFHSSDPNIHIMEDRLKDSTHNCLHTPHVVERPCVISPALHLLFHIQKIRAVWNTSPLILFLFLCPSFNWILRDRSFNVLTSLANLFSWLFKVIKVVARFYLAAVQFLKQHDRRLPFPPSIDWLPCIYNLTVFIT